MRPLRWRGREPPYSQRFDRQKIKLCNLILLLLFVLAYYALSPRVVSSKLLESVVDRNVLRRCRLYNRPRILSDVLGRSG